MNRITSNGEAIYSAACLDQSNDGQIYIEEGKLNGWPVEMLRDTGCTGMIVDRALIPDSMVIQGTSASLQMVDHTLIDVLLANVYLDSPYYKGHCKVMCVSSPIYPVIIGNVRGARQMLPDPDWKAEDQREARARTNGGNNNDDDNQGGDMPSWMFKDESNREKTKIETQRRSQIKKNDNRASQDVKVQEGTTEGKCVPVPVLTRVQAKKSDKINLLKVKEATSSVNKTTTEDLQKDSTLKKWFDQVGKPIIRENYFGEFFMKNELLYRKHQEAKTGC